VFLLANRLSEIKHEIKAISFGPRLACPAMQFYYRIPNGEAEKLPKDFLPFIANKKERRVPFLL